MGRDNVIPRRIFGHLSPKGGNPVYNEWIIGAVAYIAVLTIPWQLAAEIVVFGALLSFSAVNFVALLQFWVSSPPDRQRNFFLDALVPGFGCVFCLGLLLGLQPWTKYAGLGWLAIGLLYAAYRTRLFKLRPTLIDFSET
jgi:putrescine importer